MPICHTRITRSTVIFSFTHSFPGTVAHQSHTPRPSNISISQFVSQPPTHHYHKTAITRHTVESNSSSGIRQQLIVRFLNEAIDSHRGVAARNAAWRVGNDLEPRRSPKIPQTEPLLNYAPAAVAANNYFGYFMGLIGVNRLFLN